MWPSVTPTWPNLYDHVLKYRQNVLKYIYRYIIVVVWVLVHIFRQTSVYYSYKCHLYPPKRPKESTWWKVLKKCFFWDFWNARLNGECVASIYVFDQVKHFFKGVISRPSSITSQIGTDTLELRSFHCPKFTK